MPVVGNSNAATLDTYRFGWEYVKLQSHLDTAWRRSR